MRKRALWIAGGLALAALGFYLWWAGWFGPSAEAVFRDTLMRANAGDYEGAVRNLHAKARGFYADRPELRKATFDAITRNGTIDFIEIHTRQELRPDLLILKYSIHYKDGSERGGLEEYCEREGGWWKHDLIKTLEEIAPDFTPDRAHFGLAASRVRLRADFTKVPRAPISLRLPAGCEWAEHSQEFQDRRLGPLITAMHSSRDGYEEGVRQTRALWKEPKRKLSGEQPVQVEHVKARLFEGQEQNSKGINWHYLVLVLGTDRESVQVFGFAPPNENLATVVRESLLTVKWDP